MKGIVEPITMTHKMANDYRRNVGRPLDSLLLYAVLGCVMDEDSIRVSMGEASGEEPEEEEDTMCIVSEFCNCENPRQW